MFDEEEMWAGGIMVGGWVEGFVFFGSWLCFKWGF